ncbi:hypothetical protein GCM10023146_01950 [Nocardioides caricicola]
MSSTAHGRTPENRERLKQQFRELRDKRAEIERNAQAVTEEVHLLLRRAHDDGWSWADLAELAGFRNADVARTQAAPASATTPSRPPPDTYTVREAAARLGVTSQAIYQAIQSGRIEVADDRARGRRVYLPPEQDSLS